MGWEHFNREIDAPGARFGKNIFDHDGGVIIEPNSTGSFEVAIKLRDTAGAQRFAVYDGSTNLLMAVDSAGVQTWNAGQKWASSSDIVFELPGTTGGSKVSWLDGSSAQVASLTDQGAFAAVSLTASSGVSGVFGTFTSEVSAGNFASTGGVNGSTAGFTGAGSFGGDLAVANLNTTGAVAATGAVSGSSGTFVNNVAAGSFATTGTVAATGAVSGSSADFVGAGAFGGDLKAANLNTTGAVAATLGITGSSAAFTNNVSAGSFATTGTMAATGAVSGSTADFVGAGAFGGDLKAANLNTTGAIAATAGITGSSGGFTNTVSAGAFDTTGTVVADGGVSSTGAVAGQTVQAAAGYLDAVQMVSTSGGSATATLNAYGASFVATTGAGSGMILTLPAPVAGMLKSIVGYSIGASTCPATILCTTVDTLVCFASSDATIRKATLDATGKTLSLVGASTLLWLPVNSTNVAIAAT